jgi:hypothetical protein
MICTLSAHAGAADDGGGAAQLLLASGGRDGCVRVWQGAPPSTADEPVDAPQLRTTLPLASGHTNNSQQRLW